MKSMSMLRLIACALLAAAGISSAVSIDAVYFGQTHLHQPDHPYFGLVGERECLIKAHVTDPAMPAAPVVTAVLSLGGQTLELPLSGPATLPASIPDGLGVVQHSFANTFTATIPASWIKTGLQVTVNAGPASVNFTNMKVGAPTKVVMTMFDVNYFSDVTGDYPAGTFAELEAKWPVADLVIRRIPDVIFRELVIPPRYISSTLSLPAARIKSPSEYFDQTGQAFDGEQAAALAWNGALKRASGRSGRTSLYYLNIYGANAGGQAGGVAGVGKAPPKASSTTNSAMPCRSRTGPAARLILIRARCTESSRLPAMIITPDLSGLITFPHRLSFLPRSSRTMSATNRRAPTRSIPCRAAAPDFRNRDSW